MRDDRGSVSPWAFFAPVLLAVLIGQVAADVIRHAWQGDTPAVATVQAPAAPVQPEAPAMPAPLPATLAAQTADAAPAPVAAMPDSPRGQVENTGLRRLSGPVSAREAGESESCIGGTVALRSSNGWEQALAGNAPVRCEAVSP